MTRRELAAVKDCLEELIDLAYELRKSMVEMCKVQSGTKFFYGMNSIETWVNVALTDDDTQPIYVKLHVFYDSTYSSQSMNLLQFLLFLGFDNLNFVVFLISSEVTLKRWMCSFICSILLSLCFRQKLQNYR